MHLVDIWYRFIWVEVGSDNSARGFQVFKSRKPSSMEWHACLPDPKSSLRYGHKNASAADELDNYHNIKPGQWQSDNPLIDVVSNLSSNAIKKETNNQREYRRAYFS
ncbi:hypothetical protein DPMN_162718 [Dreissena polymorpha]|uniref:Uncharacterized protein n=1 Tax=Dreissena polymorpha TaxID=45954 RepID=A0A9D4EUN5_DREPO|nr:hypothetical protein DPMN_162718 [Dreissena polymorpha]